MQTVKENLHFGHKRCMILTNSRTGGSTYFSKESGAGGFCRVPPALLYPGTDRLAKRLADSLLKEHIGREMTKNCVFKRLQF